MAARAYWKGYLRLSLVTIPVEMFNAVETKNENLDVGFPEVTAVSDARIIHENVEVKALLFQKRFELLERVRVGDVESFS